MSMFDMVDVGKCTRCKCDVWIPKALSGARTMSDWKAGDWVVYDLAVGQIKKFYDDDARIVSFSDGHFETSGRLLDGFRPLTLRNKRIIETFDIYYNRLRDIDGEAGFNYPDIKRHFSQLALDAIDNEGSEEPFKKAQEFVRDARDYKSPIQGVRLFRPKLGRRA